MTAVPGPDQVPNRRFDAGSVREVRLVQRVRRLLDDMVPVGRPLLVGYSGGADSLALLGLLADLAKPAGQAGLQSGDVVTGIDNHPIYNIGDFWHAIRNAGDQMAFQISAQGKTGAATITVLRSRPSQLHP